MGLTCQRTQSSFEPVNDLVYRFSLDRGDEKKVSTGLEGDCGGGSSYPVSFWLVPYLSPATAATAVTTEKTIQPAAMIKNKK